MVGFTRRGGVAALAAVALCTGILAAANDGVPFARVDLNDGGVWVTNNSKRIVGHLNYPSRTLDGGLVTGSSDFDIGQHGREVSLADSGAGVLAPVQVADYKLGASADFSGGLSAVQGGDTVAVRGGPEGKVWVTRVPALGSFDAKTSEAALEGIKGEALTVGSGGEVYVFDEGKSVLHSILPIKGQDKFEVHESPISGIEQGAKIQITAVGDKPVLLDTTASKLILPEGKTTELSGEELTLQQPGEAAGEVLVSSRTQLMRVPLDGGAPTAVEAALEPVPNLAEGVPAQPVLKNGCAYGAWARSNRFVRDCPGTSEDANLPVPKMRASARPVFRVNRAVVVLNDAQNGEVWLADDNLFLVDNWQDIASRLEDEEEKEDKSSNHSQEQVDNRREKENTPPVAKDDDMGVRPGRTTNLPVLFNDTDADGDVLTATILTQPAFGTVRQIRGGVSLQIEVPEDAKGSTSFTYEADDGRGGKSKATVTLTVYPWDVNDKPKQMREAKLVITKGESVDYFALSDWIDPNGDSIYLAEAWTTADMSVSYTENGLVSIRDLGSSTGEKEVAVKVSDGRDTATGVIRVEVKETEQLPPVANADHVVVFKGETVTVSPLDNDTDPNGDRLRMVALDPAPNGVVLTPNLAEGTFRFLSDTVGTHYLNYTISDGPNTSKGIVRVDVRERSEQEQLPVADNDIAVLPRAGEVYSDVLANDYDPSGRVLVVQSVNVAPDSGIAVSIVKHELLRITAPGGLDAPVTFTYTVSNGTLQATGQVTVLPSYKTDGAEPPVAADDEATVRVNDIATVHVLNNDRAMVGQSLKLDPKLEVDVSDGSGTAFVSGETVRFRAGDKPGVAYVNYRITDEFGSAASARVTVTILPEDNTVNSEPRPLDLTARVLAGATVRIPVPLDGIDPEGDSVTLVGIDSPPSMGTPKVGATWIDYEAHETVTGTDTFTYAVADRWGKRAIATVRVGIAKPSGVNQNPVAIADKVVTRPGRDLSIPVLANDVDPDGDKLSVIPDSAKSVDGKTNPSFKGNNLVLHTPANTGLYYLSYGVSDGRGGESIGSVIVDVNGQAPLLPPIARDDYVKPEDVAGKTSVRVDVLANDSDPDGSIDRVKLSSTDTGVEVNSDRTLQVPVRDNPGVILYTIEDEDGNKHSAAVFVPGNASQPPVLNPARSPARVKAGELLTIPLSEYVIVRDGATVSLTDSDKVRAANGWNGDSLVESSTRLAFRSTAEFSGRTSISFEVTDGARDDSTANTAVLTLPIIVESTVEIPPVFTPSPLVVGAGGPPVTANLAQMVRHPQKDPRTFTYSLGAVPAGFEATLSGTTLSVSAPENTQDGAQGSIPVTVSDGTSTVQGSIPVRATGKEEAVRDPLFAPTITVDDAVAGKTLGVNILDYTAKPAGVKELRLAGFPVVAAGTQAQVTYSGNTVNITPGAKFSGTLTVLYRLGDDTGLRAREVEGKIIVTVKGTPDAPRAVRAVVNGSGTTYVSWTQGKTNGSAITGYTVIASHGETMECPSTACNFTGLKNGRDYQFWVIAKSNIGDSPRSEPSATVRVDVAPGMPTAPVLTPMNGAIRIKMTPPKTEGSPVRDYEIFYSPGGSIKTNRTEYTLLNLENATSYRITYRAINSSGAASPDSPAATAVPFGPPGPPRNVRAEAATLGQDTNQLRVLWAAPASDNGANITGYQVTMHPSGVVKTAQSTDTSMVFDAPVSSQPYYFTVVAVNAGGQSSPVKSNHVKSAGLPGAPSSVVISLVPGTTKVRISSIGAPANLGGWTTAQISYQASVNGGAWVSAGAGSVLPGGTFGQNTSVRVRTHAKGLEQASAATTSNIVVPYGTPPSPSFTKVSWNASTLVLNVADPGGNGRPNYLTVDRPAAGTRINPGRINIATGNATSIRVCVSNHHEGTGQSPATTCQTYTRTLSTGRAWSIQDDGPAAGKPGEREIRLRFRGYAPGEGVSCTYRYFADGNFVQSYTSRFYVELDGTRTVIRPQLAHVGGGNWTVQRNNLNDTSQINCGTGWVPIGQF